jgi:hypothetical protein
MFPFMSLIILFRVKYALAADVYDNRSFKHLLSKGLDPTQKMFQSGIDFSASKKLRKNSFLG